MLRCVPPPGPQDLARARELASLSGNTLLYAAVLAPSWASLIEPHLRWPGLATLLEWLKRHSAPAPWKHEFKGTPSDSAGVIDPRPALAAIGQMGPHRLRELCRHPAIEAEYSGGLYHLHAIQGANAAEVEAGLAKRNKQAIRALGLLPGRDDLQRRYLALSQLLAGTGTRQMGDRLAATLGLESLALTAGFADAGQLAWAMEAGLAAKGEAGQPSKRQLTAQRDRIARLLEWSMLAGEQVDRERFVPVHGHATALLLRCWPYGATTPLDLLDSATLDGAPVPFAQIGTVQVLHPLTLLQEGSLERWRQRLAALGLNQPFAQLLRGLHPPTADELATGRSARFKGRLVRVGPFAEHLRLLGWLPLGPERLSRKLPGGLRASIALAEGHFFLDSPHPHRLDEIQFDGQRPTPASMSEIFREVGLACCTANPMGGNRA